MRIERLDLIAFGNLTDVSVDLAAPELHIVHGPNRAGKSTARAAVSNLLYGFDVRTTYAFYHPMSTLRLGALVRANDGSTMDVVRFKRTKDPLVQSGSEQPVPEARWNALLQGMPRTDFDAMLALGWHELVHGTDELLSSGGLLGETLFGAGLGVRKLGAVLKQLEDESATLFRPRGSTRFVNAALKAAAEARKSAADNSIRPSHYVAVLESHQKADGNKAELQTERRRLQREYEALATIRRVLPLLQERRAAIAERSPLLSHGPPQPRAWAESVQQAVSSRRDMTAQQATAASQLLAAKEKLEAIAVDETLLALGDRVASLSEGITSYVQGQSDRAGLERDCHDAERDALATLRALTGLEADPPALEDARVVLGATDEITQARDEWAQRRAAVEQARTAVKDCKGRIIEITGELAELAGAVDPTALRRVVDAAVRQGDLDTQLSTCRQALGDAQRARLEMTGRLTLTEKEIQGALARPVPSSEELEGILENLEQCEARARTAQGRVDDEAHREDGLSEQLRSLALQGALPSEEELTERRGVRDATWTLVKASWLDHNPVTGGSTTYADERALALSYEVAGQDADRVVDLLWQAADRTARRQGLQADLERARSNREQESVKTREASRDAIDAYLTWRECWPGQRFPDSPRALRQWATDMTQLRSLQSAWAKAQLAHRETFRNLRTHRRRIVAELLSLHHEPPTWLDLNPLLVEAQSLLRDVEDQQRERSESEAALRGFERDLPTKETDLVTAVEADRTGATVLSSLLGPHGALVKSPQDASRALTQLNSLGRRLEERDALLQRIHGIDGRCATFESQLRDLTASRPDLTQLPVPDAARELVRQVKDARDADAKRQDFLVTHDLAQAAVDDSELKLVGLRQKLALLAHEGEVDDPEQLEAAAERAFRIIALDAVVADHDNRLAQEGNGRSISELEEAAIGRTPAEITEAIDGIKTSLNDLDGNLETARDTEASLRLQLQAMDGSDAAAAEAARSQREVSKAVEASDQFSRLALAHYLLNEAIRRYTEAHQDPLLGRASAHLRLLTADEYQRVGVDVETKGAPRLSVMAATGAELLVPALSSGSRDQLYLALRLAAIEEAFIKYGPMPVLLDDVLVNFDDTHSMAALRILATMAGTSQVLLFTHHPHLLALASEALAPDAFIVHELAAQARNRVL